MAKSKLIEDWTWDEQVSGLSAEAERHYLRCLLLTDDHGRIEADPVVLKARLYPLQKQFRVSDISRWTAECLKAGVVRKYGALSSRDSQGKLYLEFPAGKQSRKQRLVAEHPPPEGQMPLFTPKDAAGGSGSNAKKGMGAGNKNIDTPSLRSEEKEKKSAGSPGESEHSGSAEAATPTWKEVQTYAGMHNVNEASARSFFDHHQGNNLWFNQFGRLIKWRDKIISWARNDEASQAQNGKVKPGGFTQQQSKKHGSGNKKFGPSGESRNDGTYNAGSDGDAGGDISGLVR